MDRNLAFFHQAYQKHAPKMTKQHNDLFFVRVSEIVALANKLLTQIDMQEGQKHLNEIIRNALMLLDEQGKEGSIKKQETLLKDLQMSALSLPNNYQKNNNFSSLCYSVSKACIFLMALSLAFTVGYVFCAWYFSFLTTAIFVDYLVYSLSIIGIPSLSMGVFSSGLGYLFKEDNGSIKELKDKVADLTDLVSLEPNEKSGEDIETNVVRLSNS